MSQVVGTVTISTKEAHYVIIGGLHDVETYNVSSRHDHDWF